MTRKVEGVDERAKVAVIASLRREVDKLENNWDEVKCYNDSVGTNALGINGFSFSVEYENRTS